MPTDDKNGQFEFEQERQWIEAAQSNPDAFKHLFYRYYNTIFNYALRRTGNGYIAEEVTANTFFKALNKIKKYQWKGISFSAWLYRIATNEVNQIYRKSKRIFPLTQQLEASLKDDCSSDSALLDVEESISQNKKFKKIHSAIATLKSKYQTALTLRYLEEKSIKEIAEILNLSENTVKTHIRRGLKQLRERL